MHPDHRGRGFATEAAEQLLRLGFTDLDLHRIIGRCDAQNDASVRVPAGLGMRKEAHFVSGELFKGECRDLLVYAILQDEWRRRTSGSAVKGQR